MARYLLDKGKVTQQTESGIQDMWELTFYNDSTDTIEKIQRPFMVFSTLETEDDQTEESEDEVTTEEVIE